MFEKVSGATIVTVEQLLRVLHVASEESEKTQSFVYVTGSHYVVKEYFGQRYADQYSRVSSVTGAVFEEAQQKEYLRTLEDGTFVLSDKGRETHLANRATLSHLTDARPSYDDLAQAVAQVYDGKDWHRLSASERNMLEILEVSGNVAFRSGMVVALATITSPNDRQAALAL
jgi:hypothetical protein